MLIPPMPTSSRVTPGGNSGCPARRWSTATPKPSSPLSTLPNPTTSTRLDCGLWSADCGFCSVDCVIGHNPASAERDRRHIEGQLDLAVANGHRDHIQPPFAAVEALAGARVEHAIMPGAEDGDFLQLAEVERQVGAGTGVAIGVDFPRHVAEQEA